MFVLLILWNLCYLCMPMGKVCVYRVLFACVCVCVCVCVCLLVCTVTDYYGDDKATGVKFCTVVHGRPGKGISHFGKLCSPKPKIGWIWARRKYCRYTPVPFTDVERAGHSRARPTHGMCGYTAVPMIDVFVLFRLLLYVTSYKYVSKYCVRYVMCKTSLINHPGIARRSAQCSVDVSFIFNGPLGDKYLRMYVTDLHYIFRTGR